MAAPVTLEDQILSYYEQQTGCTAGFVTPPPVQCPKQVQDAYKFGNTHLLTILIAAFFLIAIAQMIFSTIFPPADHH